MLVVTFIGLDRPGLVNAISTCVADHGGEWLESRLARLAGHFAGVVRIGVGEARIEALSAALKALEAQGLRVTIAAAQTEQRATFKALTLDLLCLDRPGIVREVTETLAALEVNIEEFESSLESAAFTGEPMFKARARIAAPTGLGIEDLRRRLERLATEMTADISLTDDAA